LNEFEGDKIKNQIWPIVNPLFSVPGWFQWNGLESLKKPKRVASGMWRQASRLT
jgi:hypothetical protein